MQQAGPNKKFLVSFRKKNSIEFRLKLKMI